MTTLMYPVGWKLVPIEPTQAMLDANGHCDVPAGKKWLENDARVTWAAMIGAAPEPPSMPISTRLPPKTEAETVADVVAVMREHANDIFAEARLFRKNSGTGALMRKRAVTLIKYATRIERAYAAGQKEN